MRIAGPTVAVALAAVLSQPGCTAVGYLIGSMVDKDKPSVARPVPRSDLVKLDVGESIEVSLWDGRMLAGRYRGLQWVKAEEYAPRYDAARRNLEADTPLPALGGGARMSLANGQTASGAYLGVGPGFVSFHEEKGKKASVVSLDRVATLSDASGRSVSGRRLQDLLDARRVPTLNLLALERAGAEVTLEVGEVASVRRLERPHGARTTGALVGLAADIAVVVALVASMNSGWSDSTPNTTYTSCPLFDSFDGHDWVLDAEPLGGAVYAGAERTDLARLDRLAEIGGEYRLRLRNDQQEIDHIDAVHLLVVDHPPGTEVVPDAAGRTWAVDALHGPAAGRVIPSSAPDRRDPDLVRLVSAGGDGWVSDVWGRDPSVAEHLRDGVELAYPVPPGARSAVLVTRAGATAFAPRVLRDVLELQGRDLGLFYQRLGRDPAARGAFEEARSREVLPTIRVWDRGEWRRAGVLRDLPALVRRDQATPLDLPAGSEGVLRIRIDGPPGLWALDRAVVSFDARTALDEARVSLSRAVAEDGTDRTDRLRAVDGRRHSLLPHRDAVTLTFTAPPKRAGLARTVLVEATGYYSVLVPADGEPQREAFRRLVEEPGGVARFALEHLRQLRTPEVTTMSSNQSGGPVR